MDDFNPGNTIKELVVTTIVEKAVTRSIAFIKKIVSLKSQMIKSRTLK
jgi:hypothetical protein